MRPSRLAACSLSLVALLILSGCDFRPRGFTNDVDEARLAALADEPLFEGATTEVGGNPNTSANATMARGEVRLGHGPWSFDDDDDDPWLMAQAMLADVRDAGWSVTRVECAVGYSGHYSEASVIALTNFDDFTAVLRASIQADGGSNLRGLVPYHGESANPWRPTEAIDIGASCLEQSAPPDSTSILGGVSNYERDYLPPGDY